MKILGRKAQRKAERKSKKEKKRQFFKKQVEESGEVEEPEEPEELEESEELPEPVKKPKVNTPDPLDQEIEMLEKKLGLRKSKKKDREKSWKKVRNYLQKEGFGEDFYEFLEGKPNESPQEVIESDSSEEQLSEELSQPETPQESPQESPQEEVPKYRPAVIQADPSKKLTSLLNRLSDQNIEPITTQISELYKSNSHNILNDSLWNFFKTSFSQPSIPPQLLAAYAAGVSALGKLVGREVNAFVLDKLYKSLSTSDKNYIAFWCYLYYFEAIGSLLVSGLVKFLGENLNEDNLEYLIGVFNICGFKLRKDDPAALKEVIDLLQSKAKKVQVENKRMEFMLETLTNIKHNKKKSNPVEERLKPLKTWLKKTVTSKTGVKDSKITVEWNQLDTENFRNLLTPSFSFVQTQTKFDPKLEALAQSARMNTETRKQIFMLLMSSEDFMDAFAKLSKLKKQERDIVRVLVTCCAQEQTFNEFYALLGSKFCKFKSSFKYTFQFVLWDNLKQLNDYTIRKVCNLAKLYAHLITERDLEIPVLKIIDFDEMNKEVSVFLRMLLETILVQANSETLEKVFKKLNKEDFVNLREGIKMFIKIVLLKHPRQGVVKALGGLDNFNSRLLHILDLISIN